MNFKSTRTHLTIKEVANRWSVSQNFIRRLVWDGKLTSTRFGRAVRIPVTAVDAFAQRNTGNPRGS